jgi:hypothetical protein
MKVYLSSTLNDLGPERQAVLDALHRKCIVFDSYTADERSVRESCESDVTGCDLYIGILGLRYGFVRPGDKLSITHLEYQKAGAGRRLVFIKDAAAIPATLTDAYTGEHPKERIEAFRQLASGASRVTIFRTPDDLRWHVLEAYQGFAERSGKSAPGRIEGPPYPGLRAFLPTEADRFFGRDAERDALVQRVAARGERFLAVIGPSGSGKSSLVYAGLIPALTASPSAAGARWVPVTFSPGELGDDPFQALAAALGKTFPDKGWRVPDITRTLRNDPSAVAALTQEALGSDASRARLFLFADQFEEIFAGDVGCAARDAFFHLLSAAAASPLLQVTIAMRSDFYGRWPQDEASIALLRSGHYPVGAPRQAELKEMIVGPATAAGLAIAPRLVQRILDDTGTGALALAEYALSQLYDRREGDALTEAAYEAIGGVAGAIDARAEQAVADVAGDATGLDEETWSGLFLALANVEEKGDELAVVRRRASERDLPVEALALVGRLVDKRILMSSATEGQPPVYEVGHEAVFSHWARFRTWYARHAEDLALRRQVDSAAADWDGASRRTVLRWGWERQKPALEALRKLQHLPQPTHDAEFTDAGMAAWRVVEARLPEPLKSFLRPEPLALLDELSSDETHHHRREEIGLRLNQLGDPRRGVGLDERGLPDIAWVDIPVGTVTLETVTLETEAKGTFRVDRFRLARYPVTWAQYRAFLGAADGYRDPSWWEGRPREDHPGRMLWGFKNYPVVNVSCDDALAYCRWLGARLHLDVRLPTEWEWQWAAVGATEQEYPWPGEWNPARANSADAGIGRTAAVGLYPLGQGPFGLEDMAGNVWEWCLNELGNPGSIALNGVAARMLRGGSWGRVPQYCRAAFRDNVVPGLRDVLIGFRVCCSSPIG